MKIKIRPMTGEDKPAIMHILRATPEFKPSEVVVAEEVLDSYLNDPSAGYFTLVAETDTVIAGYVCFGLTPLTEGTWDIYWIAVERELQGKGIGATLLTVAENKIKQLKGRLMLAETSSTPEYDKTRRFYQSQGYVVVAQIADFYVPGDDKIIFQKRLK
mgnify:CR=1 FL=1